MLTRSFLISFVKPCAFEQPLTLTVTTGTRAYYHAFVIWWKFNRVWDVPCTPNNGTCLLCCSSQLCMWSPYGPTYRSIFAPAHALGNMRGSFLVTCFLLTIRVSFSVLRLHSKMPEHIVADNQEDKLPRSYTPDPIFNQQMRWVKDRCVTAFACVPKISLALLSGADGS